MGQKGLKLAFFRPKIAVFLRILYLTELGGTPPAPLTESHCAQKSLAERGGTLPPLTGKIR